MNVNGVTNGVDAYTAYSKAPAAKEIVEETAVNKEDVAAVYEPTTTAEQIEEAESKKKKFVPDEELIAKMKADAEERTSQLRSLIEKIILQQAGKTSDIFDFLGKEYSAEDIEKAKEDVSEDGYYGVKQTSQRILDFAVALTGGDPDKIEEMREAFKQGYQQAEATWGGELPDICKQTYDAVFEGFDKMAKEAGLTE